jgi:hypothetical protein
VPYFLKQLGSVAVDGKQPFPTQHYAGAEPAEWPDDIRLREYPKNGPGGGLLR